MTQDDRSDVKPATPIERLALNHRAVKSLIALITNTVHNVVSEFGAEMYREGIIAGLRVREEVRLGSDLQPVEPRDAGLRVFGEAANLREVQPKWCECDARKGSVCSPRRRPADCDNEQRWDDEEV